MYQQEIIDFVKSHTSITSLWIDANGDWHTSKTPNAKEVSRENIIGKEKVSKSTKETTNATDGTK